MDNILDQPTAHPNGRRTIDEVLTNGYNMSIGEAWSRGTDIWKKNIGGFVLFLIIALIVQMVCSFIPFVGSIASTFITGPAMVAGFFMAAYKLSMFGKVEQSDYTFGFKKIADNALFVLIKIVVSILIFIPVIISIISEIALLVGLNYKSPEGIKQVVAILMPLIGVVLICALVLLLVSVLFMLVYQLINVYGLNAITAIKVSSKVVMKNYFSFILLAIVCGLINIAGGLCLLVGLLFTIPLTYCVLYAAYEQIFENKSAATAV